jgi:hypothetical protein
MKEFVLLHRGEGRVPLAWALGVALMIPGLCALALPTEPTELFGYRLSRSIGVGATLLTLGSALLGLLLRRASEQGMLLAGEPERLARAQRLRDGIVIDDASWKELQDCERKLGLAG